MQNVIYLLLRRMRLPLIVVILAYAVSILGLVLIPGVDDGAVSVESAKTPGMTDFLILPYSHTFIMFSGEVIEQIVHFLDHGVFDHQKEAS